MGTDSTDSVDYPDYAYRAAKKVSDGEADLVIVVCGSGIGVSITANKAPGVRCALCMTPEMAALARQHNNANGLAMGARLITPDTAEKIISTFLSTDFEAGRHERRVKKIHSLSNC
jgi:ribose 5-phosphate isomerase B